MRFGALSPDAFFGFPSSSVLRFELRDGLAAFGVIRGPRQYGDPRNVFVAYAVESLPCGLGQVRLTVVEKVS